MSSLPADYRIDERLAVYGSLVPGGSNAHILAPLDGQWVGGVVWGTLRPIVSGYAAGYRGIRLAADGEPVPCMLLLSRDLPGFWTSLDEFEGAEFFRTIAPVDVGDATVEANIYEWRPEDAAN